LQIQIKLFLHRQESAEERLLGLIDIDPTDIGTVLLFDEVAAMIALEECLSFNPDYAVRPFYSYSLSHSRSLLFHFCHLGASLELVQFTFQANPDAVGYFHPEDECCTALYSACSAKVPSLEVIKFLLIAGDLSLLSATNFMNFTALTVLLQNPGVSLNIIKLFYEWEKSLFTRVTKGGITALHTVCSSGVGNSINEFIIEKFPEMMEIGCLARDYTPLHVCLSVANMREDVITLLAEKGPMAIAQCSKQNGLSPFCTACSDRRTPSEVIETLVFNYPFQKMDLVGVVGISTTTINSLFQGLNYNLYVKELNILHCKFSESASIVLFECLAKNDTLETFCFDSTSITWTYLVYDCINRLCASSATFCSLFCPPRRAGDAVGEGVFRSSGCTSILRTVGSVQN